MKTSLSILAALVLSLTLMEQTTSQTDDREAEYFIASNESGSRYLLDIFHSLSNNSILDPLTSQANTIRSLKNVAPVGCHLFNFSLSGIGHSELAIRSDLHLYMTRPHTSNERLTIEIRKYLPDNNGEDFITSKEILPNEESGWLVFPMQAYVSRLIPEAKTHVVLRVIIKSPNQNPIDCKHSPISFTYSHAERDPYLTLYSYDNSIEIDYTAMLKQLETEKVDVSPSPSSSVERRKRATTTAPAPKPRACQLNELTVNSAEIPLSENKQGYKIVYPPRVDLGICGGKCTNGLPNNKLKHSLLAHYFFSSNGYTYEGGHVAQCCAPVAYEMLSFVVKPPKLGPYVVALHNMKISKCDCLHIVHLDNQRKRR